MRRVRNSHPRAGWWLGLLATAAVLTWLPATRADEGQDTEIDQSQRDVDVRVSELIQQLGAAHYAARQRAKTELRRLRLEAFDALNEAQFHDDIEIALSARYLVRSMQVNWWTDEDSPEVKQLLRE